MKTAKILYAASAYQYWNHPHIHNFGNVGLGGRAHAIFAKTFTRFIDHKAYYGVDIRKELLNTIPDESKICDLGCGIGLSTKSTNQAHNIVGVDTSREMIQMARCEDRTGKYYCANAETFGSDNEFDITMLSFVFHEVPREGRFHILRNAFRISRTNIFIMDISPTYNPSKLMLSGEPYILEYQKNIERDIVINSIIFNRVPMKFTILDTHVTLWII